MPLHPDFPVVDGRYQMTQEWVVELPSKFNRRIEDGDLVLWRPGMTAWVAIWNNNKSESAEVRLRHIKETQSQQAFARAESTHNGSLSYSYRLAEESPDRRVPALYCYAFGEASHVQMAVYFDREQDLGDAKAICESLAYVAKKL
jgi:hypothetical protein